MILTRQEELELIHRIKEGNESAEEEFQKAYNKCFLSITLKKIVDPGDAQGIVNETLMAAISAMKECRYDGSRARIQTYITGILRHKIADYVNSKVKAKENGGGVEDPFVDEPSEAPEAWKRADMEYLRQAVRELGGDCPAIIELSYFRELKHREISDVLNIPMGTVASRLHNCLKKLRAKFLENW